MRGHRTFKWLQRITLLACSVMLPMAALAQTSFQAHTIAQSSDLFEIAGHGDFNGDGREDLIVQDFVSGTVTSHLYLSTGDGTYAAPIAMPIAVNGQNLAIGDFNHDGKLDFATTTSSGFAVFLGNGNGTFQAGKTTTTGVQTPTAFLAADLNHDNRTDLVEVANGPSPTMQVWLSNGDGTFSKGQTLSVYNPNSSGFLESAVTGDFDGDGKPDVALLYSYEGPTSVQVWYGDGAGHLGSPFVVQDANKYDDSLIAVDVNNDGRTDLVGSGFIYGVGGTSTFVPKIALFTGNANRTLTSTSLTAGGCVGQVVAADVNGDGLNDLMYWEGACSGASSNVTLMVKPGTGGGGFGAEQIMAQSLYGAYELHVLRTTHGTRPDVISVLPTAARTSPSFLPPDEIELYSNASQGNFPGCGVTVAEGINICSPGASATSPVRFSIGAAGPTPMRTAAVWIDGVKRAEQIAHAFSNYSFLDASVSLAGGTHNVTVYGTGWDNTLQVKSFSLLVGSSSGGCTAPSTAGVNVCSPVNGSTVHSPVTVAAAATITGTLARMEVWVDGVKKYTETTSTSLTTSVSLGTGYHRFDIYAVNTAGTKWEKTVYATVN